MKKLMSSTKFYPLFALLVCVLGASSCANNVGGGGTENRPNVTSNDSYVNNISATNGSITNAGYNCPDTANVLPSSNSGTTFTDRWTVCTNTQNTYDIEVQGTATQAQVCIFPATVINSTSVYPFPDTSSTSSGTTTGLPWFQCVSPSSAGTYAVFAGISYNAVFIVEESNADAMQACLYTNSQTSCPPYSYGEFR
jgi:hypothetical protein